ncbi:MAG: hypothetical protein IJ599_02935 [Alphaproteobacteria bacterium]|nr:hypothetical protein [Alphaproteobacteria bacterium]
MSCAIKESAAMSGITKVFPVPVVVFKNVQKGNTVYLLQSRSMSGGTSGGTRHMLLRILGEPKADTACNLRGDIPLFHPTNPFSFEDISERMAPAFLHTLGIFREKLEHL